MNIDPRAQQRAPIWWRVMQLLTVLAIVAFVFSAMGCTPRDPGKPAQARQQRVQPIDAAAPTWDAAALRFDHSVVNGVSEPETPETTGASVAAYGAEP